MKIGISIAIIVAIVINCIVGILIFSHYQKSKINNDETLNSQVESPKDNEMGSEKKILLSDLAPTVTNQASTSSAIDKVATKQLSDTEKLYVIATAANTIVSDTERRRAWQRELYNYNGETGLEEHLKSIGISQDEYKARIEKQLVVNTYLEKVASPYITNEAVLEFYNSLPEAERDEFDYMESSIRQTLLASQMVALRDVLLGQ
ncbi:hypothetical protein KA012_04890 [Candidatus Woesebacteria bacterium]|nr:hypothetical protein [Candidatus Woesebacteria bacterium]MBP9717292.1 hypothetical protein [Candidatus Paceibacterota bacterium]